MHSRLRSFLELQSINFQMSENLALRLEDSEAVL
jgi:hypothetical protein